MKTIKKTTFFVILLLALSFAGTQKVLAQTIGFTTTGSTSYPQTIVGNTSTNASDVSANYLVVDKFTTIVPLTAILIKTYGSVSGNVQVSIYSDASGSPGTLLFSAVTSAVTGGTWSSITIPNTYLSVGTYWLAFNTDGSGASADRLTKSTDASGIVRKFQSMTYGTAFPVNPASGSWTNAAPGVQDHIYFVGVPIQGYAKATKATLGANGLFSSVSFYSHAAGNVRLAIYSNASGAPSAKQWESGDVAVSAGAWTTTNISSGTPSRLSLSAGTYWLAWQWNSTANGPSYTAGSSGDGNFMVQSYGSFPTNWSGGTSSSEKWSMYATYSTCTPPTVYNVSGGGGYCSGGTGVAVVLTNSESGVNYQLYIGGSTPVGSPVSGTGSAITFGKQTSAGSYTVVATRSTGGCTSNMSGSATVTVNPLPTASINNKADITCYGTNNGTITILGSGGTNPYQFSVDNGVTYTSGANPNPYTFTGLSANVVYKIRIKDNNGCESPAVP